MKEERFDMSTAAEKKINQNHAVIVCVRHMQNILREKDGNIKLIRLIILVLT